MHGEFRMQMRLIVASSHAHGMAVAGHAGSDRVESSHVHIVELDAPLDTTHELTFIGGRTVFFYAVFKDYTNQALKNYGSKNLYWTNCPEQLSSDFVSDVVGILKYFFYVSDQ